MRKNIGILRTIILLILLISALSCINSTTNHRTSLKEDKKVISKPSQKKDGLQLFQILEQIDKQIDTRSTTMHTYRILDSIRTKVDGANAEYYVELYKNAILYDTPNFKLELKNKIVFLDTNVLVFFEQDSNLLLELIQKLDTIIMLENKAKINDPDGYVNLRSEPNTISKVRTRIPSNTDVQVYYYCDNWWVVKFNNSFGYVYESRLTF